VQNFAIRKTGKRRIWNLLLWKRITCGVPLTHINNGWENIRRLSESGISFGISGNCFDGIWATNFWHWRKKIDFSRVAIAVYSPQLLHKIGVPKLYVKMGELEFFSSF